MHPNFLEGETYILRKTKSINLFERFEPIILFCNIHKKLHLKRLLAFSTEKPKYSTLISLSLIAVVK